MNKKVNTVLFLLGATVFNLLIWAIIGFGFVILLAVIFKDSSNPNLFYILAFLAVIGSIAASFFIYSRVVKWLNRKIDMDKYFMPLFRRKR